MSEISHSIALQNYRFSNSLAFAGFRFPFADMELFSCMIQPKKVLTFEDAKQRAWQWKKAIEGLQNR